jgi:two-component sensor histidine kinase
MLKLIFSSDEGAANAATATIDKRVAAVEHYRILRTRPEPAFDGITALAADLFDAEIAIVAFLDRDRYWFKSVHGLHATECDGLPASTETLGGPQEFGRGFTVRAPICTADGLDIGAICVFDPSFRPAASERQTTQLKSLADMVVDLLDVRLARIRRTADAAMMANEVDHRAMNNLFVVANLLKQQQAMVGEEAAAQLAVAEGRLLAVARVHRSLAFGSFSGRTTVLPYLRHLCAELSTFLGTEIEVTECDADFSHSQILPIGLLVNELVTNARKHGAPPITVSCHRPAPGQYELCVRDRGKGLPEDYEVDDPRGPRLGMRIVATVVKQLGGSLTAGRNPDGTGSFFRVVFPCEAP